MAQIKLASEIPASNTLRTELVIIPAVEAQSPVKSETPYVLGSHCCSGSALF
jgi:hypothetical protein